MKKNYKNDCIELAQSIKLLKGLPDNMHQKSTLNLLEGCPGGARGYARILSSVIGEYENSLGFRSKIIGQFDSSTTITSLINLYLFFKEIEKENMDCVIDVLKLETGLYNTAKDLRRLKNKYFPEIIESADFDLPF